MEPDTTDRAFERALDASLRHAFAPPALPDSFRVHVRAAIARDDAPSLSARRERLEREQREALRELEHQYVRLRRRTLGSMIGGAFAAGAAVALATPWLEARWGADTPVILAIIGTAIGSIAAIATWIRNNEFLASILKTDNRGSL